MTVKRVAKKRVAKKELPSGGLLAQGKTINFDGEGLKCLIYGHSGTGKTTLWATFPKPIAAFTIGKRAGELRSIQHCKDVDQIKQFRIGNTEELPEYIKELRLHGDEFKTVVVDHLTNLGDLRLKEVLGLEDVPVSKDWGLATMQQHGQVVTSIKEYCRGFLDLPQNVVLVAQERNFVEEDDTEGLIRPYVGAAVSPSVLRFINPATDYVLQTFKRMREVEKKVKRKGVVITEKKKVIDYCLRTGPDATYITKFRIDKEKELPNVVVNATYEKLMDIIN